MTPKDAVISTWKAGSPKMERLWSSHCMSWTVFIALVWTRAMGVSVGDKLLL